jgi:hypothetical protein
MTTAILVHARPSHDTLPPAREHNSLLVVPSSKELYDALVCDLLNLSG